MSNHPSRASDLLLKKMWQTKGARFNGHARLHRRHWMSIGATSVLSCYLVGISLYQLTFESNIPQTGLKLLSVANVVVSVFLIMITLLESARNYGHDAERMHENALAISKLYNVFQALTLSESEAKRDQFANAYSDLMADARISHNELDRNLFRIENAAELRIGWGPYLGIILQTLLLTITEYWLYFTLVLVPPLLFWLFMPALS